MKISKERLKQILAEELSRVNEEDMNIASLESEVKNILKKLSIEEQSIIRQYISLVSTGDKK
jgi:DNA-directed RNA polymerase sigma subunit (sigma70/sigma32)